MESLYNTNGLVFWTEEEIILRQYMIGHFYRSVKTILWKENPAWQFVQVEAPILMPVPLLNPNYTNEDVWFQGKHKEDTAWLALRPETTAGSYAFAQYLLNTHTGYKPPLCVWQAGKSFRREQDQVQKNMRLKEFYQQEFQCIYSSDTMNDYHSAVLEPVKKTLSDVIGLPARVVESDRLPSYSQITMDVEIDVSRFDLSKGWMEVCSISRRTDFPQKLSFHGKKGVTQRDALVLEIAIGLDRCLYLHGKRREHS